MKAGTVSAALAVMAVAWVLAGCEDPSGPTSDVVLSAEVNGTAWHAGGPGAPPTHAVFYEGDNTLSVGGLRSDGSGHAEQIGFSIRNVTGPGTYALGDSATGGTGLYVVSDGSIAYGTFTMTWYTTSAMRPGTVVLLAFEPSAHMLRGTFAFEAETGDGGRVTIRGGSFTGHYQTSHLAGS